MVGCELMRRFLAVSLRRFALTAVICMLGGALSCGRETFDLLPGGGAGGALSGDAGLLSGAGAGAMARGGAGGNERGGAGGGGARGGAGGGLGFSGSAGRPPFPTGGDGAGGFGGSPACLPSQPWCFLCSDSKDCQSDAPKCDLSIGVCYECQHDTDCTGDDVCNIFTKRCAKPCKDITDCAYGTADRVCAKTVGVCVTCLEDPDCDFSSTGSTARHCFQEACIECTDGHQCPSGVCLQGICQKPH